MRIEKVFCLLMISSGIVAGQAATAQDLTPSPGGQRPAVAKPAAVPLPPRPTNVIIDAGSGRLIQLPGPAATILAADPRIARVQPASPTSIFVMGVAPGTRR